MTRTVNEMADLVIECLAEVATQNDAPMYVRQSDIADTLNIVHSNTFHDVMTRAALRVPLRYPGSAIGYNRVDGYRLLDEPNVRDQRMERGRLRKAHTMLRRAIVMLTTTRADSVLHMIGRQLGAFCDTVLAPALDSMDVIIGE